MTFDLFGEVPPAPAPAPAPPPTAPAESFMMQPTGIANEWLYRDVLVRCDMKRKGFIGHWYTLDDEHVGLLDCDTRVGLCKRIDALLGSKEHA